MLRGCLQSSLVAAALLVGSTAFAERPLVAVLDFQEVESGLASHEVELLADVARGEALDRLGGAFNIITRENLLDLLKAHGTDLEQCQGACETETGRLIGADYVVSGSIVKAFGAYKVNLKLHRTAPPELLGAEVRTSESLAALEGDVRAAVSGVLSALTPASSPSSPQPSSAPPMGMAPRPGSLSEAATGLIETLSPARAIEGLLRGGKRPPPKAEPPAEEAQEGEERDSGTGTGVDVLFDVGGFLFFGPTLGLELGGQTRLTTWYRAVGLGLLATEVFIDPDKESYDQAHGIGAGVRWYGGGGASGLDGIWYGLALEYLSTQVTSGHFPEGDNQYRTEALLAEGLVGVRWGSDGWGHLLGGGLGLAYELEFAKPTDADDTFQRVYPVLVYEVEVF